MCVMVGCPQNWKFMTWIYVSIQHVTAAVVPEHYVKDPGASSWSQCWPTTIVSMISLVFVQQSVRAANENHSLLIQSGYSVSVIQLQCVCIVLSEMWSSSLPLYVTIGVSFFIIPTSVLYLLADATRRRQEPQYLMSASLGGLLVLLGIVLLYLCSLLLVPDTSSQWIWQNLKCQVHL